MVMAKSDHGDDHHAHKNLIAGFIGVTTEDRRDVGLTLGVDYTRWVTDSFGVGVGIERVLGDFDFTVLAIPFSYRINHRWKVFAGPGWDRADHDNPENPKNPKSRSGDSSSDHTEFLVRVGVEYEIPMDGYELAPKLMLDVIDGDVVVIAGLSVGFGF